MENSENNFKQFGFFFKFKSVKWTLWPIGSMHIIIIGSDQGFVYGEFLPPNKEKGANKSNKRIFGKTKFNSLYLEKKRLKVIRFGQHVPLSC